MTSEHKSDENYSRSSINIMNKCNGYYDKNANEGLNNSNNNNSNNINDSNSNIDHNENKPKASLSIKIIAAMTTG